jgi:sec-independent protein translocase protein TatC
MAFDDKKLEITEHLDELRSRIIRCAAYMFAGFLVVYACYDPLFHLVSYPLEDGLKQIAKHAANNPAYPPGTLVFHDFTGPFMLRLHLSGIAGLIFAAPFIIFEVWGFVAPALTPTERKPFQLIAPFAVFLFFCGVALAFAIMPMAVRWFLSFLPDYPNAVLLQDPQNYIIFFAQVMLAFGLVFQLPILLLGLGKFGIVRSKMLMLYWRYIVVAITVLAMLVSPSADPLSMILLAVPLLLLFAVSIVLVKMVEPKET